MPSINTALRLKQDTPKADGYALSVVNNEFEHKALSDMKVPFCFLSAVNLKILLPLRLNKLPHTYFLLNKKISYANI